MREDKYFQRGAADPIHADQTVLTIVRQYVPGALALAYVDESGGEARMYAVDENIVLKVQRPQQLRLSTSLEKEAFFLRQLAKQSDVNVPRVLGHGRHGEIEYTCMTRIPGVCVRKAQLTPEQRQTMLFELGKTLRQIHNIDQEEIWDSGLFPHDDDADLVERLRLRLTAPLQQRAERLPRETVEQILATAEQELAKITDVDRFVALHVNPGATHTFVDPVSGRYSGLIDFGDAYIGHPIFDLRRWPTADRDAFQRYLLSHLAADELPAPVIR